MEGWAVASCESLAADLQVRVQIRSGFVLSLKFYNRVRVLGVRVLACLFLERRGGSQFWGLGLWGLALI